MSWYRPDGSGPLTAAEFIAEGIPFGSQATVARDVITVARGEITVSTVFLGLDHGWGDATPLTYETMIFGGDHDEEQWRYPTRDAALAGHDQALALVRDEPQCGNKSSEES